MKIFLKFVLFAAIVIVLVVLLTDSIDTSSELETANQEGMSQEEDTNSTVESSTEEEPSTNLSSQAEIEGSIILGGDNTSE